MKVQFRTEKITVFESALFRTTSCVLDLTTAVLVVDPNWLPREIACIRQWVEQIRQDRPLFLAFTHADYDHIIGYGAFPEAQVIATETFRKNPQAAEQIEAILQFDHDYYIERTYPIRYPVVDHVISRDRQMFSVGNQSFTFSLAPGHTPEGMFLYWEKEEILLVGDYLSNVEFPYVYHSVHAYRQTLAKAKAYIDQNALRLLIPGHGDVCTKQKEMYQRITASERYLDQLEHCIRSGDPFPLDALWKQYSFRRGMEKFHKKNQMLMEKELHEGKKS